MELGLGIPFQQTARQTLGFNVHPMGGARVYRAFLSDEPGSKPVEGASAVPRPLSGGAEISVLFTFGNQGENITDMLGERVGDVWPGTNRTILGSKEAQRDGKPATEVYLSHQPGQDMLPDSEPVPVPLSGGDEIKLTFHEIPGLSLVRSEEVSAEPVIPTQLDRRLPQLAVFDVPKPLPGAWQQVIGTVAEKDLLKP